MKRESMGYCECCEREIFEGDRVLKDNRFKTVKAYICMECFVKASNEEIVEMLGGSFEEAI